MKSKTMTPDKFLISKLSFFRGVTYEYNDDAHTHFVKCPTMLIDEQEELLNEFEAIYPYDLLAFIDDNSRYSIRNVTYKN